MEGGGEFDSIYKAYLCVCVCLAVYLTGMLYFVASFFAQGRCVCVWGGGGQKLLVSSLQRLFYTAISSVPFDLSLDFFFFLMPISNRTRAVIVADFSNYFPALWTSSQNTG